jgi:hypothetical protein
MKTGNGKIANLPSHIRDELNYRICDGDPGNELVEWLNSKPDVAEVVNKLFDGTPISEQNLSEWRKRGYQKWLAHRNFVDESNALSDNTGDIAATGIDPDKLLLTNGVIALQRAELQKVRLEIARERLELLREKRRNKSASSSGPSTKSVSSPESAPGSRHSPATAESFSAMEGSPSTAGSLPRVEVPGPPDGPPISQNIASSQPVPAPAISTPAPKPNSSAQPTARRANVPQNAPPGTVISLNPLRIVPPRPIPHR